MRAALLVPALLVATVPAAVAACLDPLCVASTIENAGFESCDGCASDAGALPDGWGIAWGPLDGAEWTTTDAATGRASLRVACASSDVFETTAARSPLVPIPAGRGFAAYYSVTAAARVETGAATAFAGAAFYDADGVSIGAAGAGGAPTGPTWSPVGSWGSASGTDPYAYAAVILGCTSDEAGATVLFDDVAATFLH